MAKKQFESSVRGGQTGKKGTRTKGNKIDYSDIPASTPDELKRARRVGRPSTGRVKKLIAIRIDEKVLADLKRMAIEKEKPYQTLIHELLVKAIKRAA